MFMDMTCKAVCRCVQSVQMCADVDPIAAALLALFDLSSQPSYMCMCMCI